MQNELSTLFVEYLDRQEQLTYSQGSGRNMIQERIKWLSERIKEELSKEETENE